MFKKKKTLPKICFSHLPPTIFGALRDSAYHSSSVDTARTSSSPSSLPETKSGIHRWPKNLPAMQDDLGSIPELGRSPGEGKGYPLQYSGLENSMDCTVHGAAKSRTWLSNFHFHFSAQDHPHPVWATLLQPQLKGFSELERTPVGFPITSDLAFNYREVIVDLHSSIYPANC